MVVTTTGRPGTGTSAGSTVGSSSDCLTHLRHTFIRVLGPLDWEGGGGPYGNTVSARCPGASGPAAGLSKEGSMTRRVAAHMENGLWVTDKKADLA